MDHEARWSYTAFLQAIGKYLDLKVELGERDYSYHYALESLLHYARWMADNEIPFSRCLHRVEYPTETWIVHDLRKSNVFEYAAKYSDGGSRRVFLEKADDYFASCLKDLEAFETRNFTRPLVMLMNYGVMHCYFQHNRDDVIPRIPHGYDFGLPEKFHCQREGAARTLAKAAAFSAAMLLLIRLFAR